MPDEAVLQEQETINYTPVQRMRHSAAHVMAEAVLEIFPDAKLAIGPAIEDGFYYDFDLPQEICDLPFLGEQAKRNILGLNAAQIFNLDPTPVKKLLPQPEPS